MWANKIIFKNALLFQDKGNVKIHCNDGACVKGMEKQEEEKPTSSLYTLVRLLTCEELRQFDRKLYA